MSLKRMNTEVEQLVEACARKDPKAQKQLYDQYAPTLMGLCMRYTHSRDEAQDLLHDGFIKIFENIGKLKKPQSLETWMRQVMISQSINYLSRRRTIILTLSRRLSPRRKRRKTTGTTEPKEYRWNK